jgi:protein tyrosine/serine phosphatase
MLLEVENYKAPTMEQAAAVVTRTTPWLFPPKIPTGGDDRRNSVNGARASRGAVVVHCGGGKGRAGTVLAVLMLEAGYRAVKGG